MLLSSADIDPLAAVGERQLKFIPLHFTVVPLPTGFYASHTQVVRNWIWRNTSGRFAIEGRDSITVGFEDASAASVLVLSLDNIRAEYDASIYY
jgi:hypothetical protein